MTIKLNNTLTHKKEDFEPIHSGKVGIYTCGPTVYDFAHIGNLRAFVFADVLRRTMELNGFEVKQVMNITDVGHLVGDVDEGEDKMIVAMKREGKTAYEIAEFYTRMFMRDSQKLNIKKANIYPKATEHIPEQIEMVKQLEENGLTYQTSDGIYFNTKKLKRYGRLSGQRADEKQAGARVDLGEKRTATDFALWKFSPVDQQRDMEWDSPWGKGFPGWHLECSAMSIKYLDAPFDIHTGGVDHIAVHHENELAQTEGAINELQANVWMHNEFLMVNGGKMSKSLGNLYTIDDIEAHSFDPLAFRYLCLGAHYSTQLNFTWEALSAAQNALNNLRDEVRTWDRPIAVDQVSADAFIEKLNNDLDTSGALAQLWAVVHGEKLDSGIKSATLLKFDEVLGLGLEEYIANEIEIPLDVRKLLEDREEARVNKDWEASDRLRDQIAEAGYIVEDAEGGQNVKEKHR